MNNKYNKVPPTLLCPLLICKYQWSASADLCAEYNTVASVTKDWLWAEIYYPDHWNKSMSRVYHLRHGLMTWALCDCGFMLFMPSVQPANSTPNRNQESSEQASSRFSLIHLTSPCAQISFAIYCFWTCSVLATWGLSSCDFNKTLLLLLLYWDVIWLPACLSLWVSHTSDWCLFFYLPLSFSDWFHWICLSQ